MYQRPLDIFRVEHQGVLWMESAATLEDAKLRIQQLGMREAGEYLVLNHLTGNKFTFNTELESAVSAG
jgi:hypothetical protein